MIPVSEAVRNMIRETPFLGELLQEGLINYSSLARKLQPELSNLLHKEVSEGAIVMALKRMPLSEGPGMMQELTAFVRNLGDMVTRTNLMDYTFRNSPTLLEHHARFLQSVSRERDIFCTFSQGVHETTIIISHQGASLMEQYFDREELLSRKTGLSSITLRLPAGNTEISGFYYFILKQLAWEGVNITEVISTTNEFTIVVSDQEIEKAFSTLLALKHGMQKETP
jgi:hypothetical protein